MPGAIPIVPSFSSSRFSAGGSSHTPPKKRGRKKDADFYEWHSGGREKVSSWKKGEKPFSGDLTASNYIHLKMGGSVNVQRIYFATCLHFPPAQTAEVKKRIGEKCPFWAKKKKL